MPDQKRLFLVDAYALIFRGYYAFIKNPRINSKGLDTSAILGFMNSLLDVIKRERPDYLAVCFDKGGSSDRNALFEDYKANRDETPEAIKIAVPYIESILNAMHIPIVVKEGYEADDIIGTLSKQAEKKGFSTFMVTPDKDFAQLVSDHIFMYRPVFGGGYETWGIPEVQKKFEVQTPDQVIDFLGMMGDSADNIPGLPGVGEKTAKKFIAQFGSLEGLLENTDQLKGKMKEKVEANKDLGLLSKQLARIILDVPVKFDEENFKFSNPDTEMVKSIFEELEFRRLIENFRKTFELQTTKTNEESLSNQPEIELDKTAGSGQFSLFDQNTNQSNKKTPFYQYIDSELGFEIFMKYLFKQTAVCFKTINSSGDTLNPKIIGIAFCWEKDKGYYLAIPSDETKKTQLFNSIKPFFESNTIEKIGDQLKNESKILNHYGIRLKNNLFDTQLAHYLINPDMRHDLSILSQTYLNHKPTEISDIVGKGKNQIDIEQLPTKKLCDYYLEQTDLIFQLKEYFDKELVAAKTDQLFHKTETNLLEVLSEMELEGINLDTGFLKSLAIDLDKDITNLETKIYKESGEEFNIASPKQLGVILFEKLQLVDKPKKTKTGQYSTAEDVLVALAKKHDIVDHILEYRSLSKLKSTYVDALPSQINIKTNRIHTEYTQTVAATGRLSSNNPNLQNIPIRTERGRLIRKAFIPRNEDYVLLAADYSQIELRIIAALSQEETMIAAFKEGQDIHAATAANIFNVQLNEITREQRSNAKTVNFGIIYGVSAFGLSNQTNLNRSEAKALIDTYYETYPKLKDYIQKQTAFARENGYVETVLGRRRYLKDINSRNAVVRGASERNAVNAPIQGSAADIIKIAMINIADILKSQKLKSKMLLQVHDELVFDAHKDEIDMLSKIIKHEMENAFKLSVPLDVEIGIGNNWLEAH